jgi:uncharacterized protein
VSDAPYLDTSALAKWYLNEPRADDFEAFITRQSAAVIGRIAAVELRCLLARRRRAGDISSTIERRAFAAFEDDIRQGFLEIRPGSDDDYIGALNLIESLATHPLRSLDAIHLAIARRAKAKTVATADRVMAEAAAALGFAVVRFD